MTDLTPAPSPLLKAAGAIARWSLRLMLTAWLLFAAVWGALHLVIVPRIGELRPMLEAQATKLLGVPVAIGAVQARSSGLVPSFELTDVKLFDGQGRAAMSLTRVVAALSPQSLLRLGFDQLYIEAPRLDVRRTAQGRILVGGLDFSKNAGPDDGAGADWLFSQTEVVVRNGSVNWTDETRAQPTLALNQVDLVLRNGFRNHRLRLDATPPPEIGGRFGAMAVFKQPLMSRHNGQWQVWDGQIYAAFERVDAAQLGRYVDFGVEVARGAGALRAWAEVNHGQFTSATADLALSGVNATLGQNLAPLAVRTVTGRIGGKRLGDGFEFATQDLQFQTEDGVRWPGGNFRVSHSGGQSKAASTEVEADRLDLAALFQIADRLPLGEAVHAKLAQWAPMGLVETIKANWHGAFDESGKFDAKGRVAGFALAAKNPAADSRAPGIRGANVTFELNQSGGKAGLSLSQGVIELPGLFEDPSLLFTQLAGDVAWQIEGDKISVQSPALKFSNADAEGQAQFKWQTSAPTAGGATATPGASAGVAGVPGARSRFPGVLDLSGTLGRAEGNRVHRYLPLVMLPQVRDYVRDAIHKGKASGVKFKVKGDLHDFPFAQDGKGEFRISANVADVTFAYLPARLLAADALPWPELTQLSGELVIDRLSLQVKGVTGRVAPLAGQAASSGLQITKADGRIPDLLNAATVIVNAEARGSLASALGVVNGSPLRYMTGQALGAASASGNADLRLKLNLPLAAIDKSVVQGSVTLGGNDVQISPQSPLLARARGVVNFSETGFTLSNVQARLFGGDVRIEGGTQAAALAAGGAGAGPAVLAPVRPASGASGPAVQREPLPVMLKAQGSVTAEAIRAAKELGLAARIAQHASGSAEYAATLGFRQGVAEWVVTSNLVGMALNLPAPLGKSAEAPLTLRFENTLLREARTTPTNPVPANPAPRLFDQLKFDVGKIGAVAYVRDISGADAKVVRGSIAVGLAGDESAPLPDEGVVANVNLASLDLDAWSALLTQTTGARLSPPESAASAPAVPPAPATSASAPVAPRGPASPALAYMPTSMAVRAGELTIGGRKFARVVVGGSREGLTWRANMDAHELNGYLEYRQPAGGGAGRVYARLARLTLAQASAKDVEALLDEQPATIPALDIVVDDLELRGRKLGRVEIEAVNRGAAVVSRDGGVREWRLNKFNVVLPEAVFTATGNWARINAQGQTPLAGSSGATARGAAERRRTVMNFRLDVNDSGELLNRFGMKDVIRRGRGKLEGQVSWVGSPLNLDYPTMGGAFAVNMEAGQFLKADPGIAKLLGVLSLQSLPRRLALDFRDVFSDGFSFDFVRGDITIDQGMASTNNLQMKGVNAAVLMEGRADIAKETQALRVIVVPEINAGTASLIASVINPAIGLGTFLAQILLRRPLIESATQEFHVDGTWVDPVVTRVPHQSEQKGDVKKEVTQ